nr:MAG TPA: Ribosome biogenesis protein Nop10, Zinc-Ribbon, RNA BINDING PROTEIN [Inoviridae sp.]
MEIFHHSNKVMALIVHYTCTVCAGETRSPHSPSI